MLTIRVDGRVCVGSNDSKCFSQQKVRPLARHWNVEHSCVLENQAIAYVVFISPTRDRLSDVIAGTIRVRKINEPKNTFKDGLEPAVGIVKRDSGLHVRNDFEDHVA
jgi:hypothetical protein